MKKLIDRTSKLWQYLPGEQRQLVEDAERLVGNAQTEAQKLTDYSYLVFPIAKMYEGFLKKLCLDLGLVSEQQYYSEHFRIGKALNPNLEAHLRLESVYDKLCQHLAGHDLADELWQAWKRGRNSLFHYFPGRLTRLTLEEAIETIGFVLTVMEKAVEHAGSKFKFYGYGRDS